MLTFAYCFFSTWCWKNTGILWVHPNLVGNMAVFVARFGCPITTPNLLHFGLKFLFWKLSEDVRTRCCQRIWTTLHNQKPKYAIEQKKRPLRVKPIMDKKKCPYGFPGIYIYIYVPDQSIDTMQQHKFRGFLHFTQDGRTWTSVVACWWCIFPASGRFLFTHGVHGNNHGTRGFINHNVQSWGYDIVLI